MTTKEVERILDNYPTKYTHGFTDAEIQDITSKIPNINMEKVHGALNGNTCMVIDGTVVNYYSDVRLAITCGIQNRDVDINEWD